MWLKVMRQLVICAAVLGLMCGSAAAQDTEPTQNGEDAAPSEATDSTLASSGPDDGVVVDMSGGTNAAPDEARGWDVAPGMEPEDVLLFVPRVVLFVPWVVFQGVFFPIRGLLEVFERHKIIDYIYEVLYWNEDETAGWFPILSFLSSAGFTYGLKVFHNDLFGFDESLTASGRFGGRYNQAYDLAFEADRLGGSRFWLQTIVRYEQNPSLLFQGIGDGSPGFCFPQQSPRESSCETFFNQERFLGLLRAGYTFGNVGELLQLGGTFVVNHRDFGPDQNNERTIESAYDTTQLVGFGDGYTELELDANIIVDYRISPGFNTTGWYLELFAGPTLPNEDLQYWHYGAELEFTLNIYRQTRLLRFRAMLEGVLGDDGSIPFASLPRLGGADRLRGYPLDRFRDEIVGFGGIEYDYPIHQSLRGAVFVDVGHAVNRYSDLFDDLADWRIGYGGGLLMGSEDSVDFRLEISYGESLEVFFSTDLARAFEDRSSQL